VLWGILGALIIVPVLASLVVILDYLRRRILGMPPFPPLEPFVLEEKPGSVPVPSPLQEEKSTTESEEIIPIKSKIPKNKKG
jgi:hypothetical protein